MPKLLWIADAVVPSGFARVTHSVLERLRQTWDVHVLGMCYAGDPHSYPYPIYPALLGGDNLGLGRVKNLVAHLKPDVVLVNHDPWVVERFAPAVTGVPMVAYCPVDAPNFRPQAAHAMSELACTVFYTEFGEREARKAGFTGHSRIVGHGVDTAIYHPVDRLEAMRMMNMASHIPEDAYIVGCVNRNQPRKRLDLTLSYFGQWVRKYQLPPNVRLYLHCAMEDVGWDIRQLARYFGVADRMIATADLSPHTGIPEAEMKFVYSTFDVQMTTTQGEGWGLPPMEGMACGVPLIAPKWAALGEWAMNCAAFVPVSSIAVTPECINTIGGIADRDAYVEGLQQLYVNKSMRSELAEAGLARVREPRFTWDYVAEQFNKILLEAMD